MTLHPIVNIWERADLSPMKLHEKRTILFHRQLRGPKRLQLNWEQTPTIRELIKPEYPANPSTFFGSTLLEDFQRELN